MSVAIIGNGAFQDAFTPAKGKNEWGMDTLTRKMMGARTLLDAFLATLRQGAIYQGYYLQSWDPDENQNVATVTLIYKGLFNGTPLPDPQTEIVQASGSSSVSFSSENGGKGRVYQKTVIFGTGTQSNVIVATQDVYATGASMDFTYDGVQTVWRYINVGKPAGPRYDRVDSTFQPTIKTARAITSDGTTFGINMPFEIGPALAPAPKDNVIGHVSRNVIGTPFYECADTVRRELVKL